MWCAVLRERGDEKASADAGDRDAMMMRMVALYSAAIVTIMFLFLLLLALAFGVLVTQTSGT